MAKKYFWLKLKDDWFNSKDIKKLRKIAGGDTYTIIYLKMQLLSLKNEGKLYYEGVEETFYEELALELNEDPENVKITISYLQSRGLMEISNTDEYLLTEVPAALASETDSAERKRNQRKKEKEALLEDKNVTMSQPCHDMSQVCHTDIDIDIEKEIDKDTEKEIDKDICAADKAAAPEPEPIITLPLNTGQEYPIFESDIAEFSALYPAVDVLQALRGMRGWCMTNPAKRKTYRGIRRFINSWLAREQDKGGTPRYRKTINQNSGAEGLEEFANRARRWADSE